MQTEIQAFNEKLVMDNIDITILEYVKLLNSKFYNLKIDFIDDFIDMIDNKDDFIIHHKMLEKYGVITVRDTYCVKRILDQYEFEESIDYLVRPPPDLGDRAEYILKPETFKMLLMRSRNTRKYAEYFILLEKSINYYNHYEKLKLQKKLKENNALKILKLCQSDTYDNFVIIRDSKRSDFQYGLIRDSDKNIRETMQDLALTDENIIFKLNVASSANFTKKVKEVLKHQFQRQKVYYNKWLGMRYYEGSSDEPDFEQDERWLTTVNRWFKLIDITINEFIDKIQEINDKRFD